MEADDRTIDLRLSNRLQGAEDGERENFTWLNVYVRGERLVLSDFMPILENMGLRVLSMSPFDAIDEQGGARIYTFSVQDEQQRVLDLDTRGAILTDAILAVAAGAASSDALNGLVLSAGLAWRRIDVLRAYCEYAFQLQVVPSRQMLLRTLRFLTPKIFDVIDELKPSWRGELEITDALDLLMNQGNKIEYDIVTGWWKDTGTPEDIIHANKLVLDSIGTDNQFLIDADSTIKKNIVIGKDTEISRDSFITGPAIIGSHCKIGPSVRLGPYVSVGNNCTLKNCNIENSIIMTDCKITAKTFLSDSIIAHESEIHDNIIPKKQQFLVGERSHLKI
jgi:glucose-1-phosphate thymidylyltransferase